MSEAIKAADIVALADRLEKGRPILFAGPMVRAILAGTKTQTRRLLKLPPTERLISCVKSSPAAPTLWDAHGDDDLGLVWHSIECPYGVPGDRLWVREAFGYYPGSLPGEEPLLYRADCPEFPAGWSTHRGPIADFVVWKPSIHMPRAASRITLEVTDVRVQRLQEISEEDAKAEGVEPWEALSREQVIPGPGFDGALYRDNLHRLPFSDLWNSLNAKRAPWDINPWVWAVTFRRVV